MLRQSGVLGGGRCVGSREHSNTSLGVPSTRGGRSIGSREGRLPWRMAVTGRRARARTPAPSARRRPRPRGPASTRRGTSSPARRGPSVPRGVSATSTPWTPFCAPLVRGAQITPHFSTFLSRPRSLGTESRSQDQQNSGPGGCRDVSCGLPVPPTAAIVESLGLGVDDCPSFTTGARRGQADERSRPASTILCRVWQSPSPVRLRLHPTSRRPGFK